MIRTKCGPNERAADSDGGLRRDGVCEGRVDFHDVESGEETGFVYGFADVVALTEG